MFLCREWVPFVGKVRIRPSAHGAVFDTTLFVQMCAPVFKLLEGGRKEHRVDVKLIPVNIWDTPKNVWSAICIYTMIFAALFAKFSIRCNCFWNLGWHTLHENGGSLCSFELARVLVAFHGSIQV